MAAVSVGMTMIFAGLYLLLRRLLNSGWRSLAITTAAIVLFWHGWSLTRLTGPVAVLLNVGIAVLVLSAAYRFADKRLFKLASFVASVGLTLSLMLISTADYLNTPDPVVEATDAVDDLNLHERPDIYLIVLDGYGRADVMKRLYGFDNSPFLTSLKELGFDVAVNSSSNYTITHLSLPSLLEMSYMNEPLDYMNNSDLDLLAGVTSGNNALVRELRDAGYTYLHGDSDHWFNTCGPAVDVCLPGPPLDVTGHALLMRTPIGGLFYPKSGDPTTSLNLTRIDQMSHWSEVRPKSDAPLFTFLHLVLPHPPLFLDRECEVRIDPNLGGRILNDLEIDETHLQLRKHAWVEQVECANMAVLDFLTELDKDDVVVITSDHGPDSRFVIETPDPDDLTADRLGERLPNLTAIRFPDRCRGTLPPDVHTVNIFRIVFDCIAEPTLPMLENHYFAASFSGSIVELKYSNASAE